MSKKTIDELKQEYEFLLDFCYTPPQKVLLNVLIEVGTQREAARVLGKADNNVKAMLKRIREKAEELNGDPYELPAGAENGCTLFERDPETQKMVSVRTWARPSTFSDKKQEELKRFKAALEGFKDDLPKYKKIKPRKLDRDQDLLNLYVLTDIHLGMLAWEPEGGRDWDLEIAEETIIKSFKYLIEHSPNAEVGYFCQLGDALHQDSMLSITPSSGHILDADSRPYKVIQATIRIFRTVTEMLLKKYNQVIILMAEGNHDMYSSIWLQQCMGIAFEKNNRVNVMQSPKPHYIYKWGKILLGFHHGHKHRGKLADLEHKFNTEFRDQMAGTIATLIHTGHKHSWKVEGNVEQHPTLAARDYYSSSNLYNSLNAMHCITYSKNIGEKSRVKYIPD